MRQVELAHEGTLFLDEIGELPPRCRCCCAFLQERSYERVGGARRCAPTSGWSAPRTAILEKLVAEGKFREDLYFRTRVVVIDAKRCWHERGPDEIEILARHFAEMYADRYGRPPVLEMPEAMAVRSGAIGGQATRASSEHWVESAVVLSLDGRIADELWLPQSRSGGEPCAGRRRAPRPARVDPRGPPDRAIERYIQATVDDCGGNKTEAASDFGVGRNTGLRAEEVRLGGPSCAGPAFGRYSAAMMRRASTRHLGPGRSALLA